MRHLPIALFLTTTLAIVQATSAAENLATRDSIHTRTTEFMAKVADGNTAGAYRHLRPYLGVDSEPYDKSAQEAAGYFKRVTEKVGNPIGSSFVKTETIGDDFTRETWLQKFKAAAIAWRFTFYQPEGNGWKLVGVSYSTELENLYDAGE